MVGDRNGELLSQEKIYKLKQRKNEQKSYAIQ